MTTGQTTPRIAEPIADRPLIYPSPRQLTSQPDDFVISEATTLLLPEGAGDPDVALARFLVAELVDHYQVAVRTEAVAEAQGRSNFMVIGTATNPLVAQLCAQRGIKLTEQDPGSEGYVIDVADEGILVAGSDVAGVYYGLQSLRQLMHLGQRNDAGRAIAAGEATGQVVVSGVQVRDWPQKGFRGLRLYLPGKENLAFFKRFLRDFAGFFKYNKLLLEVNAAMRFDRHPELNAGWYEFARSMNYTRRDRPEGIHRHGQDSAHHDTGDFGLLEKDEVADIVRIANENHIEVIPEIPSLTHAYYLLTRHRELAEIQGSEWPDTWCPLEPGAYELYFDVLDEYIEVIQPNTVHIGHDEWRMPMHVCEKCKGKDYRDLYVEDVRKIHAYLTEKGIRMALWGDHMLERVRGVERRPNESRSGYKYDMPAGLRPEQLEQSIPRDILMLNWFWSTGEKPEAAENEAQLAALGFEQVFGNFGPKMIEQDHTRRMAQKGVLGGAPSSWAITDEFSFGKDLMRDFIGCAELLWPERTDLDHDRLLRTVQSLMPWVRRNLGVRSKPSDDGETVAPLDIADAYNTASAMDEDLSGLKTGRVSAGSRVFELPAAGAASVAAVATIGAGDAADLPGEASPIAIGEDPSSVLFLHACARPAGNHQGHFQIYNFPDCADLLGWYEIEYEDGFLVTEPIRYGVNILECSWGREKVQKILCYQADPVNCAADDSSPVRFFAHEWVNPRFGKVIKEIRLKGLRNFVDARRNPISSNAVMLLAMSLVQKRPGPESAHVDEEV